MDLSPRAVLIRFRGKALKYASVSVVGVFTGVSLLFLALEGFEWAPEWANLFSVTVSSVPGYLLNRGWVWRKTSPHSLTREVLPFWGMALAGLVWSTFLVWVVDHWTNSSVLLTGTNLAAFGSLWVVKFLLLDEVLFKHHENTSVAV